MTGTDGPLDAFAYVIAEKAGAYRAVMRAFVEAKDGFRLHLRPADVSAALGGDHRTVDEDEARTLLTQLVEWGNLRADPDTAEVATVEEFYRHRFLYSLTRAGEAAERAVQHFERTLVTPGELQTAALEDIRALLGELADLAGSDDPDPAKVHRALRSLADRFGELTERAQTFIGDLQRTVDLHGIDLDAFLAYKDRLIEYLERFIGDLVLLRAQIAAAVADVETAGADRLLAMAAERELADAVDPTDDQRDAVHEAWRRRWVGLVRWFVAPTGQSAQADLLRERARQAIPALLQAVSQINERRISRTDRPADLRTLARWFAQAPTDGEAHRLWRAAFGLTSARHLKVDETTLDARDERPVAPSTSWLDDEPLHVSPQLRRTGRYLRRGRPNSVVDRTREKALLAEQAAAEARQLAVARTRLATDSVTRLSALGELDRDSFGLLLDLLGEVLAARTAPDESVEATSADGSMLIRLSPTGDGTTATIATSDGRLSGPDHHVEIVDLLADHASPEQRETREVLV